jgi:hypothetical protein
VGLIKASVWIRGFHLMIPTQDLAPLLRSPSPIRMGASNSQARLVREGSPRAGSLYV